MTTATAQAMPRPTMFRRAWNRWIVPAQLVRGLFFRYGWLRAWWENRPVDANGDALPWITYPAIDFLSQLDFSDATVFEWGSGNSSIWWAPRCKSIATVESNAQWVSYIRERLPTAVELIETQFNVDAELRALTSRAPPEQDVFVIDNHGPFRWRCAEVAVKYLRPGGLIILDNSDQCLKACQVMRDAGFTQIDFTGFVPSGGYAQTTSLFYRGGFRFRSRTAEQPSLSIAQRNPPWPGC